MKLRIMFVSNETQNLQTLHKQLLKITGVLHLSCILMMIYMYS